MPSHRVSSGSTGTPPPRLGLNISQVLLQMLLFLVISVKVLQSVVSWSSVLSLLSVHYEFGKKSNIIQVTILFSLFENPTPVLFPQDIPSPITNLQWHRNSSIPELARGFLINTCPHVPIPSWHLIAWWMSPNWVPLH